MDSFLKWVGGKRLLREKIIKKIPPHRCYVEPFGGAAWVLFHKKPSEVEVYNDLNGKLFSLFMCVKYHPDELVKELNFFLGSRRLFNAFRQQHGLTEIQKSARFLFVVKISFGGIGESFGSGRCSGGGANISKINLLAKIEQISARLDHVSIEEMDFEKCIKRYDRDFTFFYCDPPYMSGRNSMSAKEHARLRSVLGQTAGKWILSLNDCKEAYALYKGFKIEKVSRKKGIQNVCPKGREYKELLIQNF